jgi:hypothetical protein
LSSNTNIGNTPVNQGYVQLIHTGETGGIDGTLRTLYDGDGTASDLQIASNKVKISTELYIGSKTITEYIQDTVGAMFDTNGSHTNLTATYDDDGDGAIDLVASGQVTLTGTQTLSNKTLESPTFTGDIDFSDANTPKFTVTDTTNTVKTEIRSQDTSGTIGTTTDHNFNIVRNGVGKIVFLDAYTMHNNGGNDLDFRAKDSNGNVVFKIDAGTSKTEISTLLLDSVSISAIQTSSESFADNDTSLMTSAAINDKIGTEVASLVDSAPSSLDTLNELAAALGDDANFSTTVTNNIATKLAKASNLSDLANASTARSNLGLGTGAELDTAAVSDGASTLATGDAIYDHVTSRISGFVDTSGTPVDNDFAKFTDANTIEGRSASETRTDLGLVIGTNVQAHDAELDDIASIDTSTLSGSDNDKFIAWSFSSAGFVLSSFPATQMSGSTNNGLLTYNSQSVASVESNLTFDASDKTLLLDGTGASAELATFKWYQNEVQVAGAGTGNAQNITLNATHGTTLNTLYRYKITLTTRGTGTDTGAVYIVSYNEPTTTWEARMVSRGGSTSNHPLLNISGSNAQAYHNHASTYYIAYSVQSKYVRESDGTFHNFGADYHWQRDVDTLSYSDGDVNIDSNTLFVDASTDRVGIGVSNPSRKLQVAGAIELSESDNTLDTNHFALRRDSSGGGNLDVPGSMTINLDANNNETTAQFEICHDAGTTPVFKVQENGYTTAKRYYLEDTGAVIYRNSNDLELITYSGYDINLMPSGNVGIGTTAPGYKLDVAGTIRTTGEIYLDNGGDAIAFMGVSDANYRKALYASNDDHYVTNRHTGGDLILMSNNGSAGGETERLRFVAGSGTQNAYFSNVNVGIGTTSPAYKLQVSGGDIAIDVGERLYFGGGNHTYISEDADDRLRFFTGGAEFMRFTEGSSDTLGLYTNNTLAMTIDNSQNVGIGTTSPAEKLQVNGNLKIGDAGNITTFTMSGNFPIVYFDDVETGAYIANNANGLFIGKTNTPSAANDLIKIDLTNGNVGIGTTSLNSNYKMIVKRTTNCNLGVGLQGGELSLEAFNDAITASVPFRLYGSEFNMLGGAVGIGTESPASAKLHVLGDNNDPGLRIQRGNSTGQNLYFRGYQMYNAGNNLLISASDGNQLRLGHVSSESELVIDSSGNVLIGGTSASGHGFNFEVLNDHAYVKGPDGWNGTGDKAIVALGSGVSNESFGCGYVYGTGLVLSTYKLSGGGDFGSSTQNSLVIADTTGQASFINDVVAFASSDKRLKENVKPLDDALDKINKINGVEFDWIDGKDKHGNSVHSNTGHDVGVIAQEIEEVLPEVVTTRDSGYKAVKYEKIVPLLIEAIKEQQEQINELKEKLNG